MDRFYHILSHFITFHRISSHHPHHPHHPHHLQGEDGTLTTASSKQYTEFVTTTKKTCPMCKGFGEVAAPGKQCPNCNGKRVLSQASCTEVHPVIHVVARSYK